MAFPAESPDLCEWPVNRVATNASFHTNILTTLNTNLAAIH